MRDRLQALGNRDDMLPKPFLEPGAEEALASVPEHLRQGMLDYVMHGIRPGGLLCAIIAHDFHETIGRAGHDLTLEDLRSVYQWFYNYAPKQSHGDAGYLERWCNTQSARAANRVLSALVPVEIQSASAARNHAASYAGLTAGSSLVDWSVREDSNESWIVTRRKGAHDIEYRVYEDGRVEEMT